MHSSKVIILLAAALPLGFAAVVPQDDHNVALRDVEQQQWYDIGDDEGQVFSNMPQKRTEWFEIADGQVFSDKPPTKRSPEKGIDIQSKLEEAKKVLGIEKRTAGDEELEYERRWNSAKWSVAFAKCVIAMGACSQSTQYVGLPLRTRVSNCLAFVAMNGYCLTTSQAKYVREFDDQFPPDDAVNAAYAHVPTGINPGGHD